VSSPVSGFDVLRLMGYGGWLFAGVVILLQLLPFPETPRAAVMTELLVASVLVVGGLFIQARLNGGERAKHLYLVLVALMVAGWLLLGVVGPG